MESHGVDKQTRNKNNSNALHIACKKGNYETVIQLIKTDFPLNDININGATPLAVATFKGHVLICQALLNVNANVNVSSNLGIGPLFLAVKTNHIELVEMYVDASADFYYTDPIKRDYSPMFLAIRNNFYNAVHKFV